MPTHVEVFDRGAAAHRDYMRTHLGRLRNDLVWNHLRKFVPAGPLDILDVGGGTGEIAIRLVADGHTVTLVDPSEGMLHLARENAASSLPTRDRPRLHLLRASLEDLPRRFDGESFGMVVCHSTLGYLPDEDAAFRDLGVLVRQGGILSVLVTNRDANPLHFGARGLMRKAMEALSERRNEPDLLFGVQRRNFDLVEVRQRFAKLGVDVVSQHGVRVAADFMPETVFSLDYDAVLAYEQAIGAQEPWLRIARYLHLVGLRRALQEDEEPTKVRGSQRPPPPR